jgi:flagellar assembly factor FliW
MKLETTRFGDIDILEKQIIGFPDGLYGFEKEDSFTLLPFNPNIDSPMEWMQSMSSPHLAFVVTDPHLYVPKYKLKLLGEDKKKVELEEDEPFLVRCIVTIPENYTDMTANLVAPVVINAQKGIAKQFVLTGMEYDTRHYLLPEEMRTSAAAPH